jgi:hypothetical protein
MFYYDILEKLYHANIRYLIVGGLAVNLHGVPRVTQDIDLIISTDRENVEKLCNLLKELGYTPRLPENPLGIAQEAVRKEWIEKRNLKAFSFYHQKDNYKVIDIVLDSPLDFEKAFEQKTCIAVRDITIYTVSINGLMQMKQAAGRPQDTSDVQMLKESQNMEDSGA